MINWKLTLCFILIFCKALSYDLLQLFVTTVAPIRRTSTVFSSKCMTCTLQKDKENKWYIFLVSVDICIKYSKIIFTVQNCGPMSHLLGRSSTKLSSVIGSAEHLQNKQTIQPICNVMLYNIIIQLHLRKFSRFCIYLRAFSVIVT